MMYSQDYDETYVFHNQMPAQGGGPTTMARPDGTLYTGNIPWPLQVHPYIKNLQVFRCPSDADPNQGTAGTSVWRKAIPMSYAVNEFMYLYIPGVNNGPVRQAAVNFPADTYYIADTSPQHAQTFQPASGNAQNPTVGSIFNRIRFSKPYPSIVVSGGGLRLLANATNPDGCTRHLGGQTIVFADGHAKWFKWDAMIGTKADYRRSTP